MQDVVDLQTVDHDNRSVDDGIKMRAPNSAKLA
jgi:hypothetical protein